MSLRTSPLHGLLSLALSVALFVACGGTEAPVAEAGADASATTDAADGAVTDAGDAAVCVTIDPKTYDRTCVVDDDCQLLLTGTLCTGACGCAGSAFAKTEAARNGAALAGVTLARCPCAAPDIPRCLGKVCVACSRVSPAPGCPDGG